MAFANSQTIDQILTRGLAFRLPNNAPISSLYTLYANGSGLTYWSNSINPTALSTLSTTIGDVSNIVIIQGNQIYDLSGKLCALSTGTDTALNNLSNYLIDYTNSSIFGISTFSTFYAGLFELSTSTGLADNDLSTSISVTNSTSSAFLTSTLNSSFDSRLVSSSVSLLRQISTLSSSVVYTPSLISTTAGLNSGIVSTSIATNANISTVNGVLSTSIFALNSTTTSTTNNLYSTIQGYGPRIGSLETLSTNLSSISGRWISSQVGLSQSTLTSTFQTQINVVASTLSSVAILATAQFGILSTISTGTFQQISTINAVNLVQDAEISTLARNLSILTTSSILAGVYDTFIQLENYTVDLINSTVLTTNSFLSTLYFSTVTQTEAFANAYFSTFSETVFLSSVSTTISYTDGLVSSLYSTGTSFLESTITSTLFGRTVDPAVLNSTNVKIALGAGTTDQDEFGIAIGYNAGFNFQGTESVAIGPYAGNNFQSYDAVAIGAFAGNTNQGNYGVAIGYNAAGSGQDYNSIAIGEFAGGTNLQGNNAIAIGTLAGSDSQGNKSISIGFSSGTMEQETSAIAIGEGAGVLYQGFKAISIGAGAGFNNQNSYGIAIGSSAGQNSQQENAIAIGRDAGSSNQSGESVAIGLRAGQNSQRPFAVAIGADAGSSNQSERSVAIGLRAGQISQRPFAVAIGADAGSSNQSERSVAIGELAGNESQGEYSVALGYAAGSSNQGNDCVAIGNQAGSLDQRLGAVAIGKFAAFIDQSGAAVAIGESAGNASQGEYSVALGYTAGSTNQAKDCVAIGNQAGSLDQRSGAVAIGKFAAFIDQSGAAVAIGESAGNESQGEYSVAIGAYAGENNQIANSIILNARGTALNAQTNSGFYVAPVRNDTTVADGFVHYNTLTNEFVYNNIGGSGGGGGEGISTFSTLTTQKLTVSTIHGISVVPTFGLLGAYTENAATGSTATVYYTSNFSTYTAATNSFFAAADRQAGCGDIKKFGNVYYAVGRPSEGVRFVLRSTDGINWENPTSVPTIFNGGEIKYQNWITSNNGLFHVCGDGFFQGTLFYSTDGQTWNPAISDDAGGFFWPNPPGAGRGGLMVAYGNGTWVAVGGAGAGVLDKQFYYSFDGINWSITANGTPAYIGTGVIFDGTHFFAIGQFSASSNNNIRVYRSFDGIQWTAVGTIFPWSSSRDIFYANGLYLASAENFVSPGSPIYYSYDGITWNPASTPLTGEWFTGHFGYDGVNYYLGVGGAFTYLVSSDGITWSDVTLPYTNLQGTGRYTAALLFDPISTIYDVNVSRNLTVEGSLSFSNIYTDKLNVRLTSTGATIAIGNNSGAIAQSANGIAIGNYAGFSNQGASGIAIGFGAGFNNQSTASIAIGLNAGASNQLMSTIAIGSAAGQISQNSLAIAIGANAGRTNQNQFGVAIGFGAGSNAQNVGSVAIGSNAGQTSQNTNSVAIGSAAGSNAQQLNSVAIGANAGRTNQNQFGVAIGFGAGSNAQNVGSVAIGSNAGQTSQNTNSVAIGSAAGSNAQQVNSVAIGVNAGRNNQNASAVAIGNAAGSNSQGAGAVALGVNSGQTSQGASAIAIGSNAGLVNQGANAIAIGFGAGSNAQVANSIVLNASNVSLDATANAGFYVNPIRNVVVGPTTYGNVWYNSTTKEIFYNTTLSASNAGNTSSALVLTSGYSANYPLVGGSPSIRFDLNSGGFPHYIISRHNNAVGTSGNALDFWMNNSASGVGLPGTNTKFVMSVTAAGVGIGTSNPGYTLDVVGNERIRGNEAIQNIIANTVNSAVFTEYNNSAASSRFLIGTDGTGLSGVGNAGAGSIGTWSANPLIFFTNQTERMRILATGNVGIGTSNPQERLHVNGSARFDNILTIRNDVNDNFSHNITFIKSRNNGATQNGSELGYIQFFGTDTTNTGRRAAFILASQEGAATASVVPGNLRFFTTGSSEAERMRITSAGNVGIGTTTATERLTVNGNIALGHRWDGGLTTTDVNIGKHASNGTWGNGSCYITFKDSIAENVNKGTSIIFTPHQFAVPNAERMRISANGNVGIGLSNPTEQLHVNGKSRYEGPLSITATIDGDKLIFVDREYNASFRNSAKIAHLVGFGVGYYTGGQGCNSFHSFNLASNTSNTYVEAMRIVQNTDFPGGAVGIGTTTPGELLDVRGNLRVGGNANANYIAFHGTTGDGPGTFNHTYIGERIYGGTESSELLLFKGNDIINVDGPDRIRLFAAEHRFDTYTALTGSDSFSNIGASPNAINRMIITSAGNVGIGTSTPQAKLDVNGDIRVSGRIIDESGAVGTSITRFVNAGNAVVLGIFEARIPSSGNRSLQFRVNSGSYSVYGKHLYVANTGVAANRRSDIEKLTLDSNWRYWIGFDNFLTAGDISKIWLVDDVNQISWKIECIIGPNYNNNIITIKRLR
jgi:hypothetical protein